MKRVSLLWVLAVVVSAFSAGAEPAREFGRRAASAGTFSLARDGESRFELLSFDSALPAFLADVPMEAEVQIAGWPVSTGTRADVVLTRHDVYSPEAVSYRVDGSQLTQLSLGSPALAANGLRVFNLTGGTCAIPATAKSISANVTITQAGAVGDLKIYPADLGPQSGSVISFAPSVTRADNAQLRLATTGTGTVGVQNNSNGTVQLILDVNGYYQ